MTTQDHEHSNGNNQMGGFLAGLLVGGLSGATAMLLLAPNSGKKTRANIQQKGAEVHDQVVKGVEEATAQVRTKAREITHDVQKQADDLQQRGQDVIDEQRDQLGETLKDLGKTVHT
jgi:gas vesicle protein